MSDDPQFQQMLDKLNAGASTATATVQASSVTRAAPAKLRNALDALWTEALRQGELLSEAERNGVDGLPDEVVLESQFGPIHSPEGSIIVRLALTIENYVEGEEAEDE